MTGTVLGRLDEVPEGGSAGFTLERDGKRHAVMAIRWGGRVFLYLNVCPHRGLPLDFTPGQFLTLERDLILCTNHGATFRIEDGVCVDGPCIGAGLLAIPAEVRDGAIVAGAWRRPA